LSSTAAPCWRRRLSLDRSVGRDLGTRFCLGQLHAAGAAGRSQLADGAASVSLNTSVLYVGRAIGSAIGGAPYARDLLYENGFVALAFIVLALLAITGLTRPRQPVVRL